MTLPETTCPPNLHLLPSASLMTEVIKPISLSGYYCLELAERGCGSFVGDCVLARQEIVFWMLGLILPCDLVIGGVWGEGSFSLVDPSSPYWKCTLNHSSGKGWKAFLRLGGWFVAFN